MRFISDISMFWLLPWLVISIVLSFFFYRNEKWFSEIDRKWQYLLKGLRACGLFLLGLLIVGLLFESVNYRIEKPLFITLVDNSSSMVNYKDSALVRSKVIPFENNMKAKYGDKFEFVQYTVGSAVTESGEINFKESLSALSEGFESIHSNYYNRNIGCIAFVSDGNFNTNSNPIYSADKINLTPIFAVGVGDTIPKKDQYVKNVASNEIAFLKNKFPVEVDVEAIKVGKGNATVSISNNGKQISSQSVNFSNGKYDYKHLTFLLDAKELGYQRYTVSVSKANGEYNYSNNTRDFYIEILDARSKIVILAGAPHPDVAALKGVLEKDENFEVKSHLIKDWKRDLKNVDLIVWHEPGAQFDAETARMIEGAKIPVLYCLGPNTSNSVVQKLGLGLSIGSGAQTDEVQAKLNSGFQQFEVSSDLQNAFSFYPPLKIRFGDVKTSASTDVMLYQRIGSIQKNDPLLFFGAKENVKYGVLNGEGIWRWKINEYARTGEVKNFTELVQKVTQFLVVKQNTSALRVQTPKRFTKDEDVEIKAEFYNESMELITSPKIELVLKNDKNKVRKHQFGVTGNFYKLSAGKLKAGKYEWVASCKHNNKSYRKSGVFIVEDIQLENLDTRANHSVLNQISVNSKGKFYPLSKIDQLIRDIEKRKDIVEMSYREASFNDLIDYKWIFFLIVIVFGCEWFFRRWFGSY
jgi:hypothetical protein